jgi:protein TonB
MVQPPIDPRSARPAAEPPPRLAPDPPVSRRSEPTPQTRTAARPSESAAPPLPLPKPVAPPRHSVAKPPEGPPAAPAGNTRTEQRTASAGDSNVSEKERNAAMAAWRDKVAAHLQRNQRPPAGAKAKNARGTVTISFTVDRRGRILAEHVARGSGNADLDKEALATLRRAQPLPNFPPEMTQGRTELSLPIRFSAR